MESLGTLLVTKQVYFMFYYNKDVTENSGFCWFSSSMMSGLKSGRLQFYLSPHAHKMAAASPRNESCISGQKHRAAPGTSLLREETPPHLHLTD